MMIHIQSQIKDHVYTMILTSLQIYDWHNLNIKIVKYNDINILNIFPLFYCYKLKILSITVVFQSNNMP